MNRDPEPERDRVSNAARWLRGGLQASTIGFTLVLATVVGFGMGLGLDRLFKTGFDNHLGVGWFTILFTLLGIIAGFREMMRAVIRLNEDADRNEQ
jgi:F0F1-type ATP synthase assembly protein I